MNLLSPNCRKPENGCLQTARLFVALGCLCSGLLRAEPPEPAGNTGQAAADSDLLDQFRSFFANSLDGSVRWADSFFGQERYSSQSRSASGRFSVRTTWQDYRDLDVRTRLRAYLPLDNIDKRLSAVIGKGNTDELIENRLDDALDRTTEDDDWLAGLGYAPPWSKSKRITLSVGAVLTWPPDPYVRINYKFQHHFSEKLLLRLNEGLFWKESEQFGCSTSLDLDHRLSEANVLRWANWLKFSDTTDGGEYDTRLQLYRDLRENRAIMFSMGVQGETKAVVPVRQYGGFATYRQRMFKPWFFGELIAGGTMLRENEWASREFSLILGVGFEMFFDAKLTKTAPGVAQRIFDRGRRGFDRS